jgi:hypothetical protein
MTKITDKKGKSVSVIFMCCSLHSSIYKFNILEAFAIILHGICW